MRRLIILIAAVAIVVAAATYAATRAASSGPPVATTPDAAASSPDAASSPAVAGAQAGAVPRLAHVFVIVMENKSAGDIAGNSAAPFINSLIERYALAADYSALTHPSLPNYIAMTSGSTQGIDDDRNPPGAGYAVDAVSIADRLEAAGLGWKAYAEGLPAAGYADNAGRFVTKHEPFLYYSSILDDTARRQAHIVSFGQLATDLSSAATTPAFAFITPDMCSDMHDCPVSEGDAWLSRTVPAILDSAAFRRAPSLLVVTWDEGGPSDNHVVTIFAGNSVKTGYRSAVPYDHYSLLHTIEAALQVGSLTAADRDAALMSPFFK